MDQRIDSIVKRFKTALEKRGIRPDKVIVYGSHSAGSAKEYSDIDVVVVSDDFAAMSLYDRLSVLGHAVADIFEPIEPLPYTVAEFEALGPGTFVGQEVKLKGIEVV